MAEPGLNLTKDQLAGRVALHLGAGAATTVYDSTTNSGRAVDSGLRYFYFPGMVDGVPGHRWSFLRKTATIATTSTQQADDLPEDFGSLVSDFVAPTGSHRVPVIADTALLAADAGDTVADAAPEYAACRVKTAPSTATSQRYEVLWHPTPDATYTYTYTYDVMPGLPALGTDFPYGGAAHAETILAACLAMAELQTLDRKAEYWDRFVELLRGSIEYDKAVYVRQLNEPFPISKQSSTLDQHYIDLIINIGHYMNFGFDPAIWTHAQAEQVDNILQRGVRQFIAPPKIPGAMEAHNWRFLRPVAQLDVWQSQGVTAGIYIDSSVDTGSGTSATLTGVGTTFYPSMVGHSIVITGKGTYTITGYTSATVITVATTEFWGSPSTSTTFSITATGDYRLPSDFAGIEGPITHVPDSGEYLFETYIYNEQVVRRHRQRDDSITSYPQYAAVEPVKATGAIQYASDGTAPQVYNLMVWPLPDEDYIVEFKYNQIPVKVTSTNKYIPGGAYHHETVMASCLALAELERDGQQGPRWVNFLSRLEASISHDKRAIAAEKIGFNRDVTVNGKPIEPGPLNRWTATYNGGT